MTLFFLLRPSVVFYGLRGMKGGPKRGRPGKACHCKVHCRGCKAKQACTNPGGECPSCQEKAQEVNTEPIKWQESSGNPAPWKRPSHGEEEGLPSESVNAARHTLQEAGQQLQEALRDPSAARLAGSHKGRQAEGRGDDRLRSEAALHTEISRLSGSQSRLLDAAKERPPTTGNSKVIVAAWRRKGEAWEELREIERQLYTARLALATHQQEDRLRHFQQRLRGRVAAFCKQQQRDLSILQERAKEGEKRLEQQYDAIVADVLRTERERHEKEAEAIRSRLRERMKQLYNGALNDELKDREERIIAMEQAMEELEEQAEAELSESREQAEAELSEAKAEHKLKLMRVSKEKEAVQAEVGKLRTQLGKREAPPPAQPVYNADIHYSEAPPLQLFTRSTAYRKATEWAMYGFNLCDGDFGRVCQILPIFTRNRLMREPMVKCSSASTTAAEELVYAADAIRQVNLCLTNLGQTKEDWIAKQSILTALAPYTGGPGSKRFAWAMKAYGVGKKSLLGAQQRVRTLTDSDFESGIWYKSSKARYRSTKDIRYEEIKVLMVTEWMSELMTTESSHEKDKAYCHLRLQGRHTFKEGTRHCVPHDIIDLSALSPASAAALLVADLLAEDPSERRCFTARVRPKMVVGDRELYGRLLKKYPDLDPEVVSFAWFKRSEPFMVKPARRQVGLCGTCLEASYLVDDYMRMNAYCEGDDSDGEDGEEGGGKRRELLHHACSCDCDWCPRGCAHDGHPLKPDQPTKDALKALRESFMCPREERTYRCYEASCEKCGLDAKGMGSCPLETDGPGECRWHTMAYEKESRGAARNGGGGGDDDGDEEADKRSKGRVQKTRMRTGPRGEWWSYFVTIMTTFFWHKYVVDKQDAAYRMCKENLPPGHLAAQVSDRYWHDTWREKGGETDSLLSSSPWLPSVWWAGGLCPELRRP